MDKKKTEVAIAVIENDKNEVLLTQRYSPENPKIHMRWQLPGGAIEKGETPKIACVREAFEETGLNIITIGDPFIVESLFDDHVYRLISFKSKIVSGTINIENDEETYDTKWVNPMAIRHLKTLAKTYEIVQQVLKK